MKSNFFNFTLIIICSFLSLNCLFSQDHFLDWSVKNSDRIFEGKVIKSESFIARGKEYMLTKHTVEVSKIFKGDTEAFIDIITLGGTTDYLIQEWTHTTQFTVGNEGLFFGKEVLDKDFLDTPFLFAYGAHAFFEYSLNDFVDWYSKEVRIYYSEIYNTLYHPLEEDYGFRAEIIQPNSIENYLINSDSGLEFVNTSDTLIEFSFANIEFNGIDTVEFDILASTNQEGIKFSASDVYLTYSQEAFDSNAVANEKIETNKEVIIYDSIYTLSLTDEAPNIVKLIINSSGFNPSQLYPLSLTPEKIVHVKLAVENFYELAQISFDGSLMSNQSYFYNEVTGETIGFDKVYVDDPFYSFLTTSIDSFYPNPIRAGTGDTLFIVGEDFGTTKGTITFPNADTGGFGLMSRMTADDMDVTWTDTLIKVKVPSLETNGSKVAGSGSVYVISAGGLGRDTLTGLEIEFAARNIRATSGEAFRTYLADDSSGDGLSDSILLFRPSQSVLDSNSMAEALIRQAMCQWTMSTGIQIDLGTAFSGSSIPSSTNGIIFSNSSLIPTASAAVTNVQISTCTDNGESPPARRDYTQTIDVFLKADLTTIPGANLNRWYFGSGTPSSQELDFHSVVLHELGHVSNLKHSIPSSKVMFYFLDGGTTRRNLSIADINGGNDALDATNMFLNGIGGQCPVHVTRGAGCLTSINDLRRPDVVNIFPNPASEKFTVFVRGLQDQQTVIRVFNLLGQQVRTQRVTSILNGELEVDIDISNLPKGIYSITLEQGTSYFLGRVIKA